MRRALAPLALVAALHAAPAAALEPLAAPDADPPSAFTGYWLAAGWKEHPPQGPQKAKGVVFWSHGVDGQKPQYYGPPNDAMRRLARAGFDVVKIQRNPTFESRWINAGLRHVADLASRAETAKAEGYARVIAAGQSYGGIISIEASERSATIDTVIAFAPGHGSDATSGSHARGYDNLTAMLLDALGRMKAGRVAVLVAAGDVLHPNEVRGPRIQETLARRGVPFISFDERMPIRGHGAGATRQFDAWYGECLLRFVESPMPAAGETACPGPANQRFLLADGVRPATPGADLPRELAALAGIWRGVPDRNTGQEWLVVVTELKPDSARWWLATDSGPMQTASMGSGWWNAKREGGVFVSRNSAGFRHEMTAVSDGTAIEYALFEPQGKERWRVRLARGDVN